MVTAWEMGFAPFASCATTTVHSSSALESLQRSDCTRPTLSNMLRSIGRSIIMQVDADRKKSST